MTVLIRVGHCGLSMVLLIKYSLHHLNPPEGSDRETLKRDEIDSLLLSVGGSNANLSTKRNNL